MELDLSLILGIWLLLGVISAFLVYLDMRYRGSMDFKWILLCIPLSFIGFVIYIIIYEKNTAVKGRELPPKPEYGKPEYKFEEQKPAAQKAPEPVKAVEPVPEPTPEPIKEKVVENVAVAEEKAESAIAELDAQEAAASSEPAIIEQAKEEKMPEEEPKLALEPPADVKKQEEPKAETPKVRQIEGIPRCPNCRAAVSSFDDKCPSCGTKLKD